MPASCIWYPRPCQQKGLTFHGAFTARSVARLQGKKVDSRQIPLLLLTAIKTTSHSEQITLTHALHSQETILNISAKLRRTVVFVLGKIARDWSISVRKGHWNALRRALLSHHGHLCACRDIQVPFIVFSSGLKTLAID